MKKSIKLLLPLFASSLLFSFNAKSAPYISGQIGLFGYGNDNAFNNITDSDEDIALTGRFGAGFLLSLSDRVKLGVESGLTGYQEIEINQGLSAVKARRWSLDLLAVLDLYVTQNFDFFAKAGGAYVNQKYPFLLNNVQVGSISSDEFVPKAVVGLGYNITQNTNLNLSVSHEFKSNADLLPGASSLLLGVRYSFF